MHIQGKTSNAIFNFLQKYIAGIDFKTHYRYGFSLKNTFFRSFQNCHFFCLGRFGGGPSNPSKIVINNATARFRSKRIDSGALSYKEM